MVPADDVLELESVEIVAWPRWGGPGLGGAIFLISQSQLHCRLILKA